MKTTSCQGCRPLSRCRRMPNFGEDPLAAAFDVVPADIESPANEPDSDTIVPLLGAYSLVSASASFALRTFAFALSTDACAEATLDADDVAPVEDEPADDEPVGDEPVGDEPADDEPVGAPVLVGVVLVDVVVVGVVVVGVVVVGVVVVGVVVVGVVVVGVMLVDVVVMGVVVVGVVVVGVKDGRLGRAPSSSCPRPVLVEGRASLGGAQLILRGSERLLRLVQRQSRRRRIELREQLPLCDVLADGHVDLLERATRLKVDIDIRAGLDVAAPRHSGLHDPVLRGDDLSRGPRRARRRADIRQSRARSPSRQPTRADTDATDGAGDHASPARRITTDRSRAIINHADQGSASAQRSPRGRPRDRRGPGRLTAQSRGILRFSGKAQPHPRSINETSEARTAECRGVPRPEPSLSERSVLPRPARGLLGLAPNLSPWSALSPRRPRRRRRCRSTVARSVGS